LNQWGERFRLSLFGESHGAGVGVVVDGVPPGIPLTPADLQKDLDQRRPGKSDLTSARREDDRAEILSGTLEGHTTGAPICVWIANQDVRSQDYEAIAKTPRPGHADWVNHVWSKGHADLRGGGHSSGRLTAPLVAAGTIAQRILGPSIQCAAHLHQVGNRAGPPYAHGAAHLLRQVPQSPIYTGHAELERDFTTLIEQARKDLDSIGGILEFVADGVPVAWGDPFFDSLESTLSHLLFAIPAVKGVEFGAGFAAASMHGSEHNDPYVVRDGHVHAATNHAGGILGGRTTGESLRGRVAIKPASSLPGRPQASVDLETLQPAELRLKGRHDPCIAIRAVPVVQACLRIALADLALLARQQGVEGAWPPS